MWELSSKYDVGVWYEYRRAGTWVDQHDVLCGVVVNGVRLYRPYGGGVHKTDSGGLQAGGGEDEGAAPAGFGR